MQFDLDAPLRNRIREIFEPRYGRGLEDAEIETITQNLLVFSEAVLGSSSNSEWAGGRNKHTGGPSE